MEIYLEQLQMHKKQSGVLVFRSELSLSRDDHMILYENMEKTRSLTVVPLQVVFTEMKPRRVKETLLTLPAQKHLSYTKCSAHLLPPRLQEV